MRLANPGGKSIGTHKSGFTLVELLVVITILGVLVGLAIPIVSRSLDAARSATCASNLRQITMAGLTWIAENDGRLPKAIQDTDPDSNDDNMYWINSFAEQLGDPRVGGYLGFNTLVDFVHHCPTGLKTTQSLASDSGEIWGRMTYGLNASVDTHDGSWPEFPPRQAAVPHPASTIFIADKTVTEETEMYAVVYGRDGWGNENQQLAFRHRGRANVAFFDGHVESFAPDDPGIQWDDNEVAPVNPWKVK